MNRRNWYSKPSVIKPAPPIHDHFHESTSKAMITNDGILWTRKAASVFQKPSSCPNTSNEKRLANMAKSMHSILGIHRMESSIKRPAGLSAAIIIKLHLILIKTTGPVSKTTVITKYSPDARAKKFPPQRETIYRK